MPWACRRESCWETHTGPGGLAPTEDVVLTFPRLQLFFTIHLSSRTWTWSKSWTQSNGRGLWATCSQVTLFEQGAGQDNLQKSLLTSNSLQPLYMLFSALSPSFKPRLLLHGPAGGSYLPILQCLLRGHRGYMPCGGPLPQ